MVILVCVKSFNTVSVGNKCLHWLNSMRSSLFTVIAMKTHQIKPMFWRSWYAKKKKSQPDIKNSAYTQRKVSP